MKAIKYVQYGAPDVQKLIEVEKPGPKDNELLFEVRAVSIDDGDLIARTFKNLSAREFNMPFLFWFLARIAFGLNAPKNGVLASEFARDVEAVGKDVKTFKVGDPVFGYRGQRMGANAEYLCVPEKTMVTVKPTNMTYPEAAAVPYGALNLLRNVNI